MALENVVLCRGAHSASESYEYAKKMDRMIINSIITELEEALAKGDGLEEEVKKIIKDLKND